MINRRTILLGSIFAFLALLSLSGSGLAVSTAVIDFEGIPEGATVSQVFNGFGMSGDPISGFVIVHGHNPALPGEPNAAMIFDADCLPGGQPADCTGGDDDLRHPGWGNTLIITEDQDPNDPDDADVTGAVFEFDFRNWGSGSVTVESINVQDVEEEETENARIYLFSDGLDGTLVGTVDIPDMGDSNFVTLSANVDNVGTMRVDLQGSGEIDSIRISTEPTAVELLTFTATEKERSKVSLEWETAAEIDNYGFNLYRAAEADLDAASKIHFEPAAGGSGGHAYVYLDTPPNLGGWWYWLADVDTNGTETLHGPVFVDVDGSAVTSHQIFMPLSLFQLR